MTFPLIVVPPRKLVLIEGIQQAGMTSGLVGAWDLTDVLSYSGTGQTVADRSGNGNDVYLGATSGSEGSDPAFSVNKLTFNGSQFLKLVAASNPAAVNTFHKDLATLAGFFGGRTTASGGGLFGTMDAAVGADDGFDWRYDSILAKKNGANLLSKSRDAAPSAGKHMLAFSLDEAGGAISYFWEDGAYAQAGAANTWDGAYTAPDTANADRTLELCSRGNGQGPLANGSEMWWFAIWSVFYPKASFDALRLLMLDSEPA